jgi:hypothetical protein
MSPLPLPPPVRSPIDRFNADIFAAHLASLGDVPAWWIDRKRSAYETNSPVCRCRRAPTKPGASAAAKHVALSRLPYRHAGGRPPPTGAFPIDPAALATPASRLSTGITFPFRSISRLRGVVVGTLAGGRLTHSDLARALHGPAAEAGFREIRRLAHGLSSGRAPSSTCPAESSSRPRS